MSLDNMLKKIFQKEITGTILVRNTLYESHGGGVLGIDAVYPLYTLQSQKGKIHLMRPTFKYKIPHAGIFIKEEAELFGIKVGDVLEATVTKINWLQKLFNKIKPLQYFYEPETYECFDYQERIVQRMLDYKIISQVDPKLVSKAVSTFDFDNVPWVNHKN